MKPDAQITDRFVDSLYALSGEAFSEPVLRQARLCLLDYLGVSLAGARMLGDKNRRLWESLGSPEGCVTALGLGRKTTQQAAALLNGFSSHVAELDDGERTAMMHPGAPILSALLPAAEQDGLSGEDVLRGIIVGYEAALRPAGAMQPGLKDRGHHGTGIGGTLGAALGVGAALRFSRAQMKVALSTAATSASGLLKMIHGGSELKPYNAAQAALNGLTAARVAQAGFSGPDDVLDGDKGFLAIFSQDSFDPARLDRAEGDPLRIERIYRKPYAACRHCHAPIEAALKLRAAGLRPETVAGIDVRTYRWAVGGHDQTEAQGACAAKMSIPVSLVLALVSGKAGFDAYTDEWLANPDVRALAKKVRVISDDALSALVPEKRAAIVEATLVSGERMTERVDYPKGEPENPISDDEGRDKFRSLALYGGKTEAEADEILACVQDVEHALNRLFPLLA